MEVQWIRIKAKWQRTCCGKEVTAVERFRLWWKDLDYDKGAAEKHWRRKLKK